MQRSDHVLNTAWRDVQSNPTYFPGALTDAEGRRIKWHSPKSPGSSQIFCVSAFGGLARVPDGDALLGHLFGKSLPQLAGLGNWQRPVFEHSDARVLSEVGGGTPTSVDAYYVSAAAVVCVEAKLLHDAREGFGGCSQARASTKRQSDGKLVLVPPRCGGYYGVGSDQDERTRTTHAELCRLAAKDGRRAARHYWYYAVTYFKAETFRGQSPGETCPFRGAAFQLMRNFLFAARTAHGSKEFGVLALAPDKHSAMIRTQLESFRRDILLPEHHHRIAVATYDTLVALLDASPYAESKRLGSFLSERMNTIL